MTNDTATPSLTGATPPSPAPRFRSDGAADRFMRGLFRVHRPDRRGEAGAHKAFRVAVVISGVRCLITYLLIPVLVPLLSLAGWVAAPVGIVLCTVAVVNGIISMRRFWRADHPQRWTYTLFMGVIFAILAVALASDLSRLGGIS